HVHRSRVWSGARDHGARGEQPRQHDRQERQQPSRACRDVPHGRRVALPERVQQYDRDPHQQRGHQEVDGYDPPAQMRDDHDAADHGLRDDAGGHQPRQLHEALALRMRTLDPPGNPPHQHRDDDHHHSEDPVAELDPLVQRGVLGMLGGEHAAGETLRPTRAAQPGTGDTHDRTRDPDSGLRDDSEHSDEQLQLFRRVGKSFDQRVDPVHTPDSTSHAQGHVSLVLRAAHAPAATPQTSRTTSGRNGRAPSTRAARSDSASAPDGNNATTSANAPGRVAGASRMPPASSSTNHTMLASASTMSARNAPPSSTPSAPKRNVPSRRAASASSGPSGSGDHPSANAATPSTTTCTATTTRAATTRPATSSQRGSAVAASRFRTPYLRSKPSAMA